MFNNELKEKIENYIIKNAKQISNELYCDTSEITVTVCIDEDGIFSFFHNGNTSTNDVVIVEERGCDYSHNCDDCPFSDYNKENLSASELMLTADDLQKKGKIPNDFFLSSEEKKMNFEEIQSQCIIENTQYEWIIDMAEYFATDIVETYDEELLKKLFKVE